MYVRHHHDRGVSGGRNGGHVVGVAVCRQPAIAGPAVGLHDTVPATASLTKATSLWPETSGTWRNRRRPVWRSPAMRTMLFTGWRTWASGVSGAPESRRPPGSQGASPTDPSLSLSLGRRRRGCNKPRAFARNRGETGSLGTARSATQSCRCSHSGSAPGQPRVFSGISGDFGGARARSCAGETRPGEAVRRVPGIVSRACFRGPPHHPVGLRTKVLGCGTIRDKAGRMRDNPYVCWVFLWRRRPTGAQDFWLAFPPHSAIFEGGFRRF